MSASMVPVCRAGDGFEAKVMAARLGAAGILWQLRGNVEGPYPFGEVEVLVAAADLMEAAALLTPAVAHDVDSSDPGDSADVMDPVGDEPLD